MSTTYTSMVDNNGKEWVIYMTVVDSQDAIAISDNAYDDWTDATYIIPGE